jgi:hypothetical protein
MIRPLEPRTERLLALLCGFVSGLLIGGVVGNTGRGDGCSRTIRPSGAG